MELEYFDKSGTERGREETTRFDTWELRNTCTCMFSNVSTATKFDFIRGELN